MGAGSGRLGYYMVRRLADVETPARIVYVLTDMAESNVDSWREHPNLRPYLEAGLLDLAVFNPVTDSTLVCERSRAVLRPGSVVNPVAAIANYLFCVQRQDLYLSKMGPIFEEWVGWERTAGGRRGFFAGLKFVTEMAPIASGRYREPRVDRLLHEVAGGGPVGLAGGIAPPRSRRFLFPIDPLRSLGTLSGISGGRFLLLIGERTGDPDGSARFLDMGVHGDSISLPVDLGIIDRLWRERGATLLRSERCSERLEVAAMISGVATGGASRLSSKLEEILSDDPVGTITGAGRLCEDKAGTLSLIDALDLLRAVELDSRFLDYVAPVLLRDLPGAPPPLRAEACRVLKQVWEGYFALDGNSDVSISVAGLLAAAEDHAEALAVLGSSDAAPIDPRARYLAAMCHASLGDPDAAQEAVDSARDLDPGFATLRHPPPPAK